MAKVGDKHKQSRQRLVLDQFSIMCVLCFTNLFKIDEISVSSEFFICCIQICNKIMALCLHVQQLDSILMRRKYDKFNHINL